MFATHGTVVGILDSGFLLDAGGPEPLRVATQTRGRDLGLRPGDEVHVLGGPGGEGVFASSSASKSILWGRHSIRVPVSLHEKRSWLWWLP